MCRKKSYLTAREAEERMQELRNEVGFVGKNETILVANMVKNAKMNSHIGDKLIMVIDPKYAHIPDWQRRIRLSKAYEIGNHYNKYKWDDPKILYYEGMLICIDGQHRIFGAAMAEKEEVVVEVMECSLEEAIDLFLSQSEDRTKMQPMDIYRAALAAGKPEYVKFHDICAKHNVLVKGDEPDDNAVGTFTSISDGVKMCRTNAGLLDSMLALLGKLEWNGYADTYNGKAYTSKVIRALKSLYAYYAGRENEMEEILIKNCKGTEFFVNNIMEKNQAQVFDYLSDIVRYEMDSPFKETKKKVTRKSMKAI